MSLEKTSVFIVPADVRGPTSCFVCGCRLERIEGIEGWRHYRSNEAAQDGRGCRTACLDIVHDGSGRPLEGAVPS